MILLFAQPLFNLLSPKILLLISSSYGFLSDSIYKTAASGIRYTMGTIFANISASAVFGFSIGLLVARSSSNKKKVLESTSMFDNYIPYFLIIVAITLYGQAFYERMTIRLNTSFEQRMTIIAPYINDQEEEKNNFTKTLLI